MTDGARATGGCLCGAVRYEIDGPLRDVLVCHCVECRRWSGHFWAATATRREHLVLRDDAALRWIRSPASENDAQRGFCGECGSSLFWDAPARETISIAAGSLDSADGLRVVGHTYVAHVPEYYDLPADGAPRYPGLVGPTFEPPAR